VLKVLKERTETEQSDVLAYEASRSDAEQVSFRRALGDMELWYAHQGTCVLFNPKLPHWYEGRRYDERGWTCYEFCMANLIKKHRLVHATWSLLVDLSRRRVGERYAPYWPTSAGTFRTLIATKTFTNGADVVLVTEKYSETSSLVLRYARSLDYSGSPIRGLDSDVLRECTNLRALKLAGTSIDDDVMEQLFASLGMSHLPCLEHLTLDNNCFGDRGVLALVSAIGAGAMRKLQLVSLEGVELTSETRKLMAKHLEGLPLQVVC
jgi:hypothetical protein